MTVVQVDAPLRVDDRQPSESLLATFGLDNSMRSGGVIMVFIVFLLDVWCEVRALVWGRRVVPLFQSDTLRVQKKLSSSWHLAVFVWQRWNNVPEILSYLLLLGEGRR